MKKSWAIGIATNYKFKTSVERYQPANTQVAIHDSLVSKAFSLPPFSSILNPDEENSAVPI